MYRNAAATRYAPTWGEAFMVSDAAVIVTWRLQDIAITNCIWCMA